MSRTWHARSLVMLGAFMIATSCGRQNDTIKADEPVDHSIAVSKRAVPAACASSAGRLALSGLCPETAASLMLTAPEPGVAPPEGCDWTIGEVALLSNEVLLYRAARCGSRTAKLGYLPVKPLARFALTASPYEGPVNSDDVIARVTVARDQADLLSVTRRFIEDPAERARCHVRPAAVDGWPSDALVVDEVPPPPADGVRSACGELGLDEDAQTFWRLSQGRAWFFQLGQESPVIDAESFTLVHKDAKGDWQRR